MERAVIFFFALQGVVVAASVDLLLVTADDVTLRPVLQGITGMKEETQGAWRFWRGRLCGKDVVATCSEGDPLNAVAATTLAVRRHSPRLIVVFGPARAHDVRLKEGDVVVSERFAAFDGMVSRPAGLGEGSDSLRWKVLPHLLATPGEKETPTTFFPADRAAREVALKLNLPGVRVLPGVLGSAHQVNREADRVAWIREQWQTSTEDGDSAHVAGVALLLGIPVVGLRIVEGSAAQSADLVLRFVEAWK